MRLLKRILLGIVVVLVVLVIAGCGAGYWFITKSQPQIDGALHVAGIKSKVEIVRDPLGIPHLYADNTDDLFFAEGFVQAQDRLWQMEYNRRIGHGTLSEMFGAATIKQDRFLRTIGLGRAAAADYAALTDAERQPLQAFANGVNAFVATHGDNLPIEFTILGIRPAPWTPIDTLVWGKVMAFDLGGNYDAELLRASLIQKFGEAKTQALMPPYPAAGPFTIPPAAKDYSSPIGYSGPQIPTTPIGSVDLDGLAQIKTSLGLGIQGVGSNDWVVDGSKTTTGKPIVANDPHLGIQMPSIWYEIGLHCVPEGGACPYNVVGYTFPGVPGVIVGHNDRIAWAVTNVGPDVQDLYAEQINPQNPNQYWFDGNWEDMQVMEEPIKVGETVSETLHVQVTHHGPVMTPVLGSGVTTTLALQWTALRERSHLFVSALQIDRAQNWDDFRNALRLWDAPSQNFVYADVDGNIGYQMPGLIPIRAKGDGTVPVPGTGDYEWTGYIPFDDLPFVYNPPTHFIATANQAVVPSSYKYLITADWSAPFREQRIVDLLASKDKLSTDDIKAIQADVFSSPLVRLQKSIVGITPDGFLQQRAMDQVKKWDGRETTDNIGGTILEVTFQRILANTFANKMEGELFDSYGAMTDYTGRVVLALLDQPNSDWWDDPKTAQKETRDDVLKKSVAEAVDWLGSQFGDAPGDWHWGRLHAATFGHPLGSVQPLNLLFNAGPVGAPGGLFTITRGEYAGGKSFGVTALSSMRMIVDLSNLSNSLQIHTTGQSGQPLDKHYSDMVLLWRDAQYAPMYFDRSSVDRVKEGTLTLLP